MPYAHAGVVVGGSGGGACCHPRQADVCWAITTRQRDIGWTAAKQPIQAAASTLLRSMGFIIRCPGAGTPAPVRVARGAFNLLGGRVPTCNSTRARMLHNSTHS